MVDTYKSSSFEQQNAESIRQFGIEVKNINLFDEIRMSVSNAQVGQIMINSN